MKSKVHYLVQEQDSSVGIAISYGLEGWGSIPGRDKDIFIYSTASRAALRPPIQLVQRALPPRVQRPCREADHSPAPTAEVKNDGAIPPPTYVFMPRCLINYFTFYFYNVHNDPQLNQIVSQMNLCHIYFIRENLYLNIFIPFY
jgi:hypothetical protein